MLSRQRGKPLGAVISELILKATGASGDAQVRNGVQVFPKHGATVTTLDDVNKLRE
jgi:hypothetical protein